MTNPDAPHGTAQDYADAQLREWTTYRARVAIDFYGTRAYNVGDPVAVSAVDGDGAWISREWVEAQGDSPMAGSATSPPPEPPPIDPAVTAAPPASSPDPGMTVTSTED